MTKLSTPRPHTHRARSTRAVRRISIGLATAALSSTLIALPAHADATHPDVFTFNAQRLSGDIVEFSGQYATWDSDTGSYKAADDGVTIQDRAPGTDAWNEITGAETDAAGNFVGYEHVRPARELRAATYETDPPAAVSNTASVAYQAPLVSTWAMLQAVQPKKSKPVEVSGQFGGWAAWEATGPNDTSTEPDGGMTEYATPVAHLEIQWKIKGKWKTVKKITRQPSDSGGFVLKVKKPKSTTWRVLENSDAAYTPSTSETFHTTKTKFVGN